MKFASSVVFVLLVASASHAHEPELKAEAHFECTVSVGQYWPGDLKKGPKERNLFIQTDPFAIHYKVMSSPSVSIGIDDMKTRFDSNKKVPFTKQMAKGYDLELPFTVRLRFTNSLALETGVEWLLPGYGIHPLVLKNGATIVDKRLRVSERFVLPHRDNKDPDAQFSFVNVTVACTET